MVCDSVCRYVVLFLVVDLLGDAALGSPSCPRSRGSVKEEDTDSIRVVILCKDQCYKTSDTKRRVALATWNCVSNAKCAKHMVERLAANGVRGDKWSNRTFQFKYWTGGPPSAVPGLREPEH